MGTTYQRVKESNILIQTHIILMGFRSDQGPKTVVIPGVTMNAIF